MSCSRSPRTRRAASPLWALAAALSVGPTARAECPDPTPEVLTVDAEHFEFLGYDARQGLASVRPAMEVPGARDRPVRLALPDQPLLMPLLPAEFEAALEARAGGLPLELLLDVSAVPGPEAEGECARYTPEVRALRVAGATLEVKRAATPTPAEAPSVPASVPAPPQDPRVRVESPRFDPGSAPTDGDRLRRQAAHIAARCLLQTQDQGPTHGALVIELRTSLVGQRLAPKPVVDGLVHRELSRCLVDRLFADAALWHDLPPGLQVYLPFYFRPGMPAPSAPEANGANAP